VPVSFTNSSHYAGLYGLGTPVSAISIAKTICAGRSYYLYEGRGNIMIGPSFVKSTWSKS
jgi:hypothetical protein